MQIKDMNSEELKALIENTIDDTLESYFGDPDEGKTLKEEVKQRREHLTCAMSINAYSSQKLENLEPDHKEK
ncbi:MAG: hypothetical protein ACK552_16805 [Microcystis sp.]